MDSYNIPWKDRIKLKESGWLFIIVVLWLGATYSLMIADVWDETNAILLFQSWRQDHPLFKTLMDIWSQPTAGLYRPLPVTIAFLFDTLLSPENKTWLILRNTNVLLLLGSFGLMLSIIRQLSPHNTTRDLIIAIAFFSSSSVLISATWFANIFDVMAIFLILLGFWCIVTQRNNSAFVCLTLSFFCKEISVIALPFILILYGTGHVSLKRCVGLILALFISFISYVAIRQGILPIGSEKDIHTFDLSQLKSTCLAWFESLWWQHTRRDFGILGLACSLLFFISIKRWYALAACLVAMLACSLIYVSMLTYSTQERFTYLVFEGRLYLVPATLLLMTAGIWGRTWLYAIVVIPIMLGTLSTYRDYRDFQQVYFEIYELARTSPETIIVHHLKSTLDDQVRNIKIGNYDNAQYRIITKSSKIIRQ